MPGPVLDEATGLQITRGQKTSRKRENQSSQKPKTRERELWLVWRGGPAHAADPPGSCAHGTRFSHWFSDHDCCIFFQDSDSHFTPFCCIFMVFGSSRQGLICHWFFDQCLFIVGAPHHVEKRFLRDTLVKKRENANYVFSDICQNSWHHFAMKFRPFPHEILIFSMFIFASIFVWFFTWKIWKKGSRNSTRKPPPRAWKIDFGTHIVFSNILVILWATFSLPVAIIWLPLAPFSIHLLLFDSLLAPFELSFKLLLAILDQSCVPPRIWMLLPGKWNGKRKKWKEKKWTGKIREKSRLLIRLLTRWHLILNSNARSIVRWMVDSFVCWFLR